jgi:hypothetical protein
MRQRVTRESEGGSDGAGLPRMEVMRQGDGSRRRGRAADPGLDGARMTGLGRTVRPVQGGTVSPRGLATTEIDWALGFQPCCSSLTEEQRST